MPRRPFKKVIQNEKKFKRRDKSNKYQYSRLRGMKDVLFDDYRYLDLVLKKAENLTQVYGFKKIETPILEKMELYEKSTGRDTDIVSKEMYSFIDKSEERIALRPEITPSLVRAYIEHGMFSLPQPVKMYSMGPCFRHEKPQAGRYRQFSQIDFEVFGEKSPIIDVQLIQIAYSLLNSLQLDVQVQINSIGCSECRKEYVKKLVEFYKERGRRAKLCNDCKRRLVKNPLRLLDCKEELCQQVRNEAPQIIDFLCEDCKDHFIKVLEYLDELDISYNLNPFLVRGLDYYNKTVFEFVPVSSEKNKNEESPEGRQSSLGGGGRYDGLVEHMGGRPTPAAGVALGIERIISKIKEKEIPIKEEKDFIFLAQLGDPARRKMMKLFEEMQKMGYKVRQAFIKDNLKAQLEEANKLKSKICLILGQKELLDGTILIRDMESATQEVISFNKLYPELDKKLKG